MGEYRNIDGTKYVGDWVDSKEEGYGEFLILEKISILDNERMVPGKAEDNINMLMETYI